MRNNRAKVMYKYRIYHIDPDDCIYVVSSSSIEAMLEAKKRWPWQALNIELVGNQPVSDS